MATVTINVSWTACPNSASASPDTTHVERSDNGGSFVEIATKAYGESFGGLQYQDGAAVIGHVYQYRVKFSNSASVSAPGPITPPVTATIPVPQPPTVTTAQQV